MQEEHSAQAQHIIEQLQTLRELLHIEEKQEAMEKLEKDMADPDFWNDQETASKKSQRFSALKQTVELWSKLHTRAKNIGEMQQMDDAELQAAADKELNALVPQVRELEIQALLSGKYDDHPAIVSMHAGAGGTEAQDWVEMLRRMLFRYAEKKEWKVELLDESRGTEAGIKSTTFRVDGLFAYGSLASEHGVHRLVRISPFDAEGMRHTSFASIEVIPEIDHADVDIDEKDLRIDTFMSSGKGGQSVNTTYSAVRIVHEPTGITVQCQNERSQLQNKETAMRILLSKLQQKKEAEEEAQRQKLRGEHKTAEWGNQIRSYVLHPYKMVKDLRTKHESADPDAVLDGDLQPFVEAYLQWKAS